MDFTTCTADQFAAIDADAFAALLLDDVSSSSSSSSSEEFSSSSSSSEDDLLGPMPTNMNQTVHPIFWLSGAGQFRGASFGIPSKIDESVSRTTGFPRIRYPTALHLLSPYSNSEIRYTLNGKNPTNNSYLYTGPLMFRQNATGEKTTVKARIYDKTNSNVKSRIIRLEFRVLPVK